MSWKHSDGDIDTNLLNVVQDSMIMLHIETVLQINQLIDDLIES